MLVADTRDWVALGKLPSTYSHTSRRHYAGTNVGTRLRAEPGHVIPLVEPPIERWGCVVQLSVGKGGLADVRRPWRARIWTCTITTAVDQAGAAAPGPLIFLGDSRGAGELSPSLACSLVAMGNISGRYGAIWMANIIQYGVRRVVLDRAAEAK